MFETPQSWKLLWKPKIIRIDDIVAALKNLKSEIAMFWKRMGGQCMMGAIKAGWEGRRGGGAITIMWAQGSHANHHSDCWIVKICQEESWYICAHHLFEFESESKRPACDMFGFNVSQAWIGVWQLGRRGRNWECILHHHCMISDQVVQKLSTCWNMLAPPCRLVNTRIGIRRHHHHSFCFKAR